MANDELTDLVLHMFDVIHKLWELVKSRLTNVQVSFTNLTIQQWIRLVAIVGAYALLRPYVLKHAAKYQEGLMVKRQKEDEAAEISANQLREQLNIPEDSDDEDDVADAAQTSASDWGKKARKRQRQMIKKMIDIEEKRLQETADEQADKDIEEFLTQ
ncbi:DUF1531-domain-containing protein [Xylariaceae sp. FL0255]|nr:DUF1531-domain-containing protein [Xylariaceae sp. FL0255]